LSVNVAMVGAGRVGKTSLLSRFLSRHPNRDGSSPTSPRSSGLVDVSSVKVAGVTLHVWDLKGQAQHPLIRKLGGLHSTYTFPS